MQPGVIARHGTSDASPAKVPSLIGLEDIKFLDSTGLMRHRSIGDLMRYAAANYGLDIIAHYGDFQPQPVMTGFAEDGTRFSDEQLAARRKLWKNGSTGLRNDYVPQGFHLGAGPIKGHEFGLKLTPDEKKALIAFLKTL